MSNLDHNTCQLLADAFRYPVPGLDALLASRLATIGDPAIRKSLGKFVQTVQVLSLGEWEELFTRTFDLNPAVAPYLGYQIWGDGYPRGNFMAAMSRAYRTRGLDDAGELPDHLGLVLRYLGSGGTPPVELGDVFAPATQKMLAVLNKADKSNPYIALLEVISQIEILPAAEAG